MWLLAVVAAVVLAPCLGDGALREMEFGEGEAVTLPPYQVKNPRNGLHDVVTFYSPELLNAVWGRFKGVVGMDCLKDLEIYLRGLETTKMWALKMDDASGSYSAGWFWGNYYWSGSRSLCEHILTESDHQVLVEPQEDDFAPYPVAFSVAHVSLNASSLDGQERTIYVGLCLPQACTQTDISTIIESSAPTSLNLQVHNVRTPRRDNYSIWQDSTFIILCTVTLLLATMLAAGTTYDFYVEHLREKLKIVCLSDQYSDIRTEASSIRLDVIDGQIKNGSCARYIVNHNEKEYRSPKLLDSNLSRMSKKGIYLSKSLIRFIIKEVLMAFSIRSNVKAICDQSVGSDTIPVIHGLKTLSMAWVVLGHTCIVAFKYSDNMEYRKVVERQFMFQTVTNGAYSVDTFFFCSGLLVSFLYFRTRAKGKLDSLGNGRTSGLLHFLGLLFYRFARLTAPYLFTIGVVEVAMKWLNHNSVFDPPTLDHENCPNYWWRNVLYINTLFPVEQMCMLWSWYLADDTQFYVVGSIILILATRHMRLAGCLIAGLLASSWATTGYVSYSNRHSPGVDDPLALFDEVYDKPWTRLGPYLIGMCLGWYLYRRECRVRLAKWVVIAGWTACFGCLLALVYGLNGIQLPLAVGAIYSALGHSLWGLALAWLVLACCTGYGGPVSTVLGWPGFYPLSRVTYCAYLVHPLVIRAWAMTGDRPVHLGEMTVLMAYLGLLAGSYGVAFILSLALEAPVVGMLRIMAKVGARTKPSPQEPPTSSQNSTV